MVTREKPTRDGEKLLGRNKSTAKIEKVEAIDLPRVPAKKKASFQSWG